MDFFNNIYDKLDAATAGAGNFSVGGWFIIILVALIALFVIIAVLTICNKAHKLRSTSKKVSAFIAGIDSGYIDASNVADFEAKCIAKAPKEVKESWASFMEVKFGYPSDYMTDELCVRKSRVEYCREWGVSLYNACIIIFVGLFFILGMTVSDLADVLEKSLYCVITGAIASFLLTLIGRLVTADAIKAFFKMQDELDAAVDLQQFKTAEPELSDLDNIADMLDGVLNDAIVADPDAAPEDEDDEDMAFEDEAEAPAAYEEPAAKATEVKEEKEAPVAQPAAVVEEAPADDFIEGVYDDEEEAPVADAAEEAPVAEEAPADDYIEGVYDDEDEAPLAEDVAEEEEEKPEEKQSPEDNYIEGVYDDDEEETPPPVDNADNGDAANGSDDFFPEADNNQNEAIVVDSADDETASSPTEDTTGDEQQENELGPSEDNSEDEQPDDSNATEEVLPEAAAPIVEEKKEELPPPKMSKLSAFFPILMASKASRATYIKITKVLIGAYSTSSDPRDKAILKDGLKTMLMILSRK